MTDLELIQSCVEGNKRSQNILYLRFVSPMGRLCIRYLKNEEEAKDALIEGFLKVFSNLKKFEYRGKESLEVWIRKIMIYECLMRLRKNRKRTFLSISEEDSIGDSTIEEDLSAEEILQCMLQLPDGYRTVLNLYLVEGYTHKEISEMLNISESASRSQLSHAREKLRTILLRKGWK